MNAAILNTKSLLRLILCATVAAVSLASNSLEYGSSSATYYVGVKIENSPTMTTIPDSFMVAGGMLPDGVSLSAITGVISGFPLREQSTDAVILAKFGNLNETVTLAFRISQIQISYSASSFSFRSNEAVRPISPIVTPSGAASSFTILPASLPRGLSFDTTTGTISGQPAAPLISNQSYTVTATNVNGGLAMTQMFINIQEYPSSPIGLASSVVGQTSCVISWTQASLPSNASEAVTGYELSRSSDNMTYVTIGTISPSTTTQYTVTGLSPSTLYYIRVSCVTASGVGPSSMPVAVTTLDVAPSALSYHSTDSAYYVGIGTHTYTPTVESATKYMFSIKQGVLPAGLLFSQSTGIISGVSTQPFDAQVFVEVSNTGGSVEVGVPILIQQILVQYPQAAVNIRVGHLASSLAPTVTPLLGASQFTVSPPLPLGLAMDGTTGVISGTPLALSSPVAYMVTASNSGMGKAIATISLAVADVPSQPLDVRVENVFSTMVVLNWTLASDSLEVTGYKVAVTRGSGLVDVIGSIDSGLPGFIVSGLTQATTYSFSVLAINSLGPGSYSAVCVVKTLDTPPSNFTYTNLSPVYYIGVPIQPNVPIVSGAVESYAILRGALPQGLVISNVTGAISGVPQFAGVTDVTVEAINSGGMSPVIIHITVASISISYPASSFVLTRGRAFDGISPTVTPAGGATHFVASPSLPSGLVLDDKIGMISGTPTTVITTPLSCIITASNSGLGNAAFTISFAVHDVPNPVAVPSSPLVTATSVSLAWREPANNGESVSGYLIEKSLTGVTFDVVNPNTNSSNLQYTVDHLLPSTTYYFTVSAINRLGVGSSSSPFKTITLAVKPANFSYSEMLPVYYVGVAIYPDTPSIVGESLQFVLDTSGDALPAGLTLNNATGVITGTPISVGSSVVHIDASNSGGSVSAVITVAVKQISINYDVSAFTLAKGHSLDAVIPEVIPVGGAKTFVVSPTLPAGLVLDSVSGALSGTPSIYTPGASYTVVATNGGNGKAQFMFTIAVHDVPGIPSVLAASSIAQSSLTLTWVAPASFGEEIRGYKVESGLTSTTFTIVTPDTGSNRTQYLVDSLNPSTSYFFRVSAINSIGVGSASASLQVRTLDVIPTAFSYTTPVPHYYVGVPITPNTPIVTGTVISYGIDGTVQLPTGLILSTSTGVISGTPAGVSSQDVQISATNSGGKLPFTMHITVDQIEVIYVNSTYKIVKDSVVTTIKPSVVPVGGASVFAVTPALPKGLSFSQTDGSISGSATVLLPTPIDYTIKGSNLGGGIDAVTLTLSVVCGPGKIENHNHTDCVVKILCPNNCNGLLHGSCDYVTGSCSCIAPWSGNDCGVQKCPSDCGGHGHCNTTSGICSCDDGWSGSDCKTHAITTTTPRSPCDNGIKDNGEEQIDCGGPCPLQCRASMLQVHASFLFQGVSLSKLTNPVRQEVYWEYASAFNVPITSVDLSFTTWSPSGGRSSVEATSMSAITTVTDDDRAIAGLSTIYEIVDKNLLTTVLRYFSLTDAVVLMQDVPTIHRIAIDIPSTASTTPSTTPPTTTTAIPTASTRPTTGDSSVPTSVGPTLPAPPSAIVSTLGYVLIGMVAGTFGGCIVLGGVTLLRSSGTGTGRSSGGVFAMLRKPRADSQLESLMTAATIGSPIKEEPVNVWAKVAA